MAGNHGNTAGGPGGHEASKWSSVIWVPIAVIIIFLFIGKVINPIGKNEEAKKEKKEEAEKKEKEATQNSEQPILKTGTVEYRVIKLKRTYSPIEYIGSGSTFSFISATVPYCARNTDEEKCSLALEGIDDDFPHGVKANKSFAFKTQNSDTGSVTIKILN